MGKFNSDIRHDTYWRKVVGSSIRTESAPYRHENHHFFCDCCVPKFRNQPYITTRPYVRAGYGMWDDRTIVWKTKVFTKYTRKDWRF